jgi:hypothetical protein
LSEFKDFYKHSRPHQTLTGQTPTIVCNAQVAKRREKERHAATASPARYPLTSRVTCPKSRGLSFSVLDAWFPELPSFVAMVTLDHEAIRI